MGQSEADMAKEQPTVKVQIRVVEVRGASALVEWVDSTLRRAILPVPEENELSVEELELGVAYGAPWEKMVTFHASPEALANELRARGIWTREDLLKNQPAAFGALQAVYGIDLAALIRAAEEA